MKSIRTYILFSIGSVFFRANTVTEALAFLKRFLETFKNPNQWIFFDQSIIELGVQWYDINSLIVSVLILLIVGALREKYGYARTWVDKQILPFRWFIWIFLFFFILIYGNYGPGYNAAAFIYENF